MRNYPQSGQVILVVVLVVVLVLTVGLSVVSRSIVNLKTSTEEENSQRAFSAAEAGIELQLKTSTPLGTKPLENNSTFTATINSVTGSQFLLKDGNPIPKDEGVDVWLSDYPTFANPVRPSFFLVFWGDNTNDSCTNPKLPAAIEIIVVSGPIASPQTTRYGFDPCSSRRADNSFSNDVDDAGNYTTPGFNGGQFKFKYRLKFASNPPGLLLDTNNARILRIIPLYAKTPIGISACNSGNGNCTNLPAQGKKIESIGNSGGTSRKIFVSQGYPELPDEFFQYVLFSTQ